MTSSFYYAACKPVEIHSREGKQLAQVACARCGQAHDWWISTSLPPPDIVRKHFTNKGWCLRKRAAVYPDCNRKAKEPVSMTATKATPILSAVAPANPDAQKKHKRLVVLALEDCFDEKTMRYRPGHDDATVAKELDLSAKFIIQVREEFFGKLAEPEGVAEMRTDIASIEMALVQAKAKFAALCARHGW